MRSKIVIFFVVLSLIFPQLFETKATKYLMGTKVDFIVVGKSIQSCKTAMYFAFQEIERIENLLSVHKPASEISLINSNAFIEPVAVSKETFQIIQRGKNYSKTFKGYFDISIGNVSFLWGFSGDSKPTMPNSSKLQAAIKTVDCNAIVLDTTNLSISFKKDLKIDLGGIAKGYAIDRAAEMLKKYHIYDFLINAGGDVYASGKKQENKKWIIGVKDPRNHNEISTKIELHNAAIATSGDYERFFIENNKRYHHILNPKTGMPSSEFRSISVVSKTAEEADVIATYLFIRGISQSENLYTSYCIDSNGNAISSTSFKTLELNKEL